MVCLLMINFLLMVNNKETDSHISQVLGISRAEELQGELKNIHDRIRNV